MLSCKLLSRGISYNSSTRNSKKVSDSNPYIDLDSCKNDYVLVIIFTAMSRFDDCDNYTNDAYKINCSGVIDLARRLSKNLINDKLEIKGYKDVPNKEFHGPF